MSHLIVAIAAAIALFTMNGVGKVHAPMAPIVMDALPPSGG